MFGRGFDSRQLHKIAANSTSWKTSVVFFQGSYKVQELIHIHIGNYYFLKKILFLNFYKYKP